MSGFDDRGEHRAEQQVVGPVGTSVDSPGWMDRPMSHRGSSSASAGGAAGRAAGRCTPSAPAAAATSARSLTSTRDTPCRPLSAPRVGRTPRAVAAARSGSRIWMASTPASIAARREIASRARSSSTLVRASGLNRRRLGDQDDGRRRQRPHDSGAPPPVRDSRRTSAGAARHAGQHGDDARGHDQDVQRRQGQYVPQPRQPIGEVVALPPPGPRRRNQQQSGLDEVGADEHTSHEPDGQLLRTDCEGGGTGSGRDVSRRSSLSYQTATAA